MSLPGGASDKIGNRYESRWAVKCLIEVLTGRADSIRFEPPGDAGKGFEFWLRRGDKYEYYQVKRQNGTSGRWSLAELDAEAVLVNFRERIQQDQSASCFFISTHCAYQLEALSERSRNAHSWDEFRNEFLKSKRHKEDFENLSSRWQYSHGDDSFNILKRIFVQTVDENTLSEINESKLAVLFEGNTSNIADVLALYSLDKIHCELNSDDIFAHLKSRGYNPRNLLSQPDKLEVRLQDKISEFMQQQSLGFTAVESLLRQSIPEKHLTATNERENLSLWEELLDKSEEYYELGNFDKALATVNKAIELKPDDSQIVNAKGCILAEYAMAQGGPNSMFYDAIDLFESLREKGGKTALLDYNIGNCQSGLGDYKKAIDYFDRALAAKPDPELGAQIWKNRGTAYFNLGNEKEEIISYQKALSLNPSLFEAYVCMGAVELRKKDYEKAREYLETAFNISPDKEMSAYGPLYSLAYSLWTLQSYEESLRRCNQFLILQPKSKDGLLLKAHLLSYLWRENPKYVPDAIIFLENWILDNPGDLVARSELHTIYYSNEYHHDPIKILNQMAQSPITLAQTLYHYAKSLEAKGEPKSAIKYLEIAYEKSQDHHIVHQLGILNREIGDYHSAIKYYELAAKSCSHPASVLADSADCFHFLGEYKQCVRVLTVAIICDHYYERAWDNLDFALYKLKKSSVSFMRDYLYEKKRQNDKVESVVIQAMIDELLSRMRVNFGDEFVNVIKSEASEFRQQG